MNRAAAREDIRRAEAARVVGQLDAGTLSVRASGWRDAGLDSSNVRALAGASDADVSSGVKSALLAEIAAEFGLGFATLQEARSVRAVDIVRSMGAGENVSAEIFGLSNGLTDEWVARFRSLFRRRKHPDP